MNATPVWKDNPLPGTPLYVNSVGISGNGQRVVGGNYSYSYGTANHTVSTPVLTVGTFLWDASGTLKWKDTFQATEGVYWAAISRDGAWAASGGKLAPSKGFVFAYDAATGAKTLNYTLGARISRVALSGDGSYLVAGGDNLYFFKRTGSTWAAPKIIPSAANDRVVSVDISDDGQWIVAGSYGGIVSLIHNSSGVLSPAASWQQPSSEIYWVAMAASGAAFVAAARTAGVLCFKTNGFSAMPKPAWSMALPGCPRCGAVAISANGALVSAVGNIGTAGKVFLFSNQGTAAKQLWVNPTAHNPNSTSLDAAGKFVTVADGQPDGTPGMFYLFDAAGNTRWTCVTGNMSWPMQISSDGSGVAAGSDDSNVYYFA